MTLKDNITLKLANAKPRKVRTRMLREALNKGSVVNGNHAVDFSELDSGNLQFLVYYQNTLISNVTIGHTIICSPVDAGAFELTPATIRQRKELSIAVDELRAILGGEE